MAVSCGVDIVRIDRVAEALKNPRFIFRTYTEEEADYCKSRGRLAEESFAGRFAAKEAVSKALGTGLANGVFLTDIEILNGENGKPEIRLSGGAAERYKNMGGKSMDISISHDGVSAIAFAVLEY